MRGSPAMWASVAGGWGQHADYADARGAQNAERMLELARVGAGDRVLELACGPGRAGARGGRARRGPAARSSSRDVAEEMTAIAAARAAELGLGNVAVRRLDLERIDEPDASYDVVLCREGLMFALEPDRALAEIRRVLRPGGRVAVAVWAARERNPWLGLRDGRRQRADRGAGAAARDPWPVRARRRRRAAPPARRAGLADVQVGELSVPLRAASFDDWWGRTSALAGPLSAILASMPEPAMQALRERAREAARPYETASGGLDFPGVTLIAAGRRA